MKRIFLILVAIFLLFTTNTFAALLSRGFTHPEIGEYLTVKIDNRSPSFDIYGFTYYTYPPSSKRYRGCHVNLPAIRSDNYSDAKTALTNILRSAEGELGYTKPIVFEYRGPEKIFAEQLNSLDLNERVEALLLLNGFEGVEGYHKLKESGLLGTDVDLTDFVNAYRDYEVVLFNNFYPYRVMSFYYDEGDDATIEHYTERYHFLKINDKWKLVRVVKEYGSYYNQRKVPVFGLTSLEDLTTIDYSFYVEPLIGLSWKESIESVQAKLGLTAEKNKIIIDNSEIYRLPAKAELAFTEGGLTSISYKFSNIESYYASFLSSYLRYYDPVWIDKDLNMYWFNDSFDVKLNYHSSRPSITFFIHEE